MTRSLQWPTGEMDGENHPYGHPSQYGLEVGLEITAAIMEEAPRPATIATEARLREWLYLLSGPFSP